MKRSFGILMYRMRQNLPEFLLVHPGGPFFRNKDVGVWSVPKGEGVDNESPLASAIREFEEETGCRAEGNFIELEPVQQKGGKQVFCWAVEGEFDVSTLKSNTFSMEWPPNSGKMTNMPEVDRAEWFTLDEARLRINEKQIGLLDQVAGILKADRL